MRLRLEGAQKTGMFLDQRLNRPALAPFAPGARVFDGHCHLGLWACHAARAGAREIIAADSAEAAIALARENAEANASRARSISATAMLKRCWRRRNRLIS